MVDLTISNFFSKRIFPSFGISILTVLIASFQIHAQGTNSIVIGTIESSIERKQVPIDLGKTSRSFASKVGRAISLHGGLRLADTKSSLFSANFTQEGQSGVKLELLKGQPKVPFADFSLDAGSVDLSLSRVLDAMVEKILKIPGFFSGKITYLSSLSGHKEVFVSDSLMSNARPQTSFGKITFNPSWSNDGQGIFFTSNRKIFNNVYFLSLRDRKISTIANYRGSNLCAVQNPRSAQTALILSTSGNPEVWIATSPKTRPKRLTNNRSNESGPTWSPDGRRLLVTSDLRGKPQIYEASLSTGRLQRIPTNVSTHCTEPAWNPRYSNLFAFTAAVSGGFQVCLYDFEERKTRIITSGTAHHIQPTWANDGRHLYITQRTSTGATRVMILDTEFEEAKPSALHNEKFGNCSQVSFYYPN
jgi:TolB protein